jgi:hypothetical protein
MNGQAVMPGIRLSGVAPCSRNVLCPVASYSLPVQCDPLRVYIPSGSTVAITLSHGVTTHLPNELALKMDGA